MLVGTLAISGVPFFRGFTRKTRSWPRRLPGSADPRHFLLFLLPALGATLTALYMFRMWFLTFAGEPREFVSEVAAEVRRRGRGSHLGRRRGGPWPWPERSRPQPGRARPRERAGHDLAADHPGRVQRLRRLDGLARIAAGHARAREDDRVWRAHHRDRVHWGTGMPWAARF